MEGEGGNLAPAYGQHLPWDVVRDNILPRLPVKSLLRFRCVSKSWLRLISDPQFTTTRQGIFVCLKDDRKDTYDYYYGYISADYYHDIDSDDHDCHNYSIEERIDPPWNKAFIPRICGSCNGLLLLCVYPNYSCSSFDLWLWNPFTRDCYFKISRPDGYEHCFSLRFGLSYDSLINDYKVVTTSISAGGSHHVVFFPVKTNSWKWGGELPYSVLPSMKNPQCVNGILHWVAQTGAECRRMIIYFDSVEETIKELPLPLPEHLQKVRQYNLMVLRGSLCLCTAEKDLGIEIWELKDYRCWTKLITFPCCPHDHPWSAMPLYFTKKDQVICITPYNRVAIYDCSKNRWKTISDLGDNHFTFSAVTYEKA